MKDKKIIEILNSFITEIEKKRTSNETFGNFVYSLENLDNTKREHYTCKILWTNLAILVDQAKEIIKKGE
jgi:hypothetical protein